MYYTRKLDVTGKLNGRLLKTYTVFDPYMRYDTFMRIMSVYYPLSSIGEYLRGFGSVWGEGGTRGVLNCGVGNGVKSGPLPESEACVSLLSRSANRCQRDLPVGTSQTGVVGSDGVLDASAIVPSCRILANFFPPGS